MTEEQINFDRHPRLKELLEKEPEDKQATRDEDDSDERKREANQAHEFRDIAFWVCLALLAIVVYMWISLMCSWPAFQKNTPTEAYYLYGVKTILSSGLFLAFGKGLLTFAIQCYGLHNSKNSPNNDSSKADSNIVAEIIKQLIKLISDQKQI